MKVFKISFIIFLFLSLTANKCKKSVLPAKVGDVINEIEQELMVDSSLYYLYNWHIGRRDRALVFSYYNKADTNTIYQIYLLIKHKKKYLLKKLGDDSEPTFTFPFLEKEQHIENEEIRPMDFLHMKKVFDELHLYSIFSIKENGILMFSFTEPLSLIYSYKENKEIGQTNYKAYTSFNEHWFYIKRSRHD